jgi:hypothetical protein
MSATAGVHGSSQRNQVLLDSFPNAWFEVGGRDQVDAGTEDGF